MSDRRTRPSRRARRLPPRRWVRDLINRNNALLEVVAGRLKQTSARFITVADLARLLRVRRGRAQRFAERNDLLVDIGGGAPRVVVARLERLLERVAQAPPALCSAPRLQAPRPAPQPGPRRQTLYPLADD